MVSKNFKNQSLGVVEYTSKAHLNLLNTIVELNKLKDGVMDYNMHIKNLPAEVDVKSSADW
ncbi:hypothetical protein MXB_2835 [Myxobolus squamalis]|nr:hypothetical protein MXB_2835 [Myxobolus squamalis]